MKSKLVYILTKLIECVFYEYKKNMEKESLRLTFTGKRFIWISGCGIERCFFPTSTGTFSSTGCTG